MHTRLGWLAVAAVTIPPCPAFSHHSNSAYKVDQIITLTGTVKEWRWTNPHTWLYLTVKGEDGKEQEWAVEGRPPGMLARAGWSNTVLRPGETVTVHASPSKNGEPVGIIARVTKADGTVLGNAPNFNRELTTDSRATAPVASAAGAPSPASAAPAAASKPSFAGV